MAVYDPPQPLWKRNLAGILDFLVASIVFGLLLARIFPSAPHAPVTHANGTTTTGGLQPGAVAFKIGSCPHIAAAMSVAT